MNQARQWKAEAENHIFRPLRFAIEHREDQDINNHADPQQKTKDALIHAELSDHQVVKISFLLLIMLEKKLRGFDIEDPLPPRDLLSGAKDEEQSQKKSTG